MILLKTAELQQLIKEKFNSKKEFIETAEIGVNTLPRILKTGQCNQVVAQKLAAALGVDLSRIAADVDYHAIVIGAKGNALASVIEEIQTVCEKYVQTFESDVVDDKALGHLERYHAMLLESFTVLSKDTPDLTLKTTEHSTNEEGINEEFSSDNPNPTIDPMTGAPFNR